MKLKRETIIQNIHRIQYDNKSVNWNETLAHLAILNYRQLLECYTSELNNHLLNLKK